jgi:hypothetical protein
MRSLRALVVTAFMRSCSRGSRARISTEQNGFLAGRVGHGPVLRRGGIGYIRSIYIASGIQAISYDVPWGVKAREKRVWREMKK